MNENLTNEQFLQSRNTSLIKLKEQYKGRQLGELVLEHLKPVNSHRINDAILGLGLSIHPELKETTKLFFGTVIYGFATTKQFWKQDCGDALILYTNATKAEGKKINIEVTDDYAFDTFNLMVLSLAQKALYDLKFKRHIKKSVRKYWLF